MGRSRSRSSSRKRSRRRSSSRSKHSKKSRHRTPERKSSKYRHRSDSSSDSSAHRYKASSSSKYKSFRHKKRDSRSPSSSHRSRRFRRSTSSSDSTKSSSKSSSRSSSSSDKQQRKKPSSSYMDKIRSIRTPTPPPQKSNFDAGMEFLDKRQISDALEELNANEFRPKSFNSSTNKSEKSDADVVKVKGEPRIQKIDSNDDPLFHQKVSFSLKERKKNQENAKLLCVFICRYLVTMKNVWNSGFINFTKNDRKCLLPPIE